MEALKFSPQDALAFQELGRTLLALQQSRERQRLPEKGARRGRGTGGAASLCPILVGHGRSDEAAAEMKRYLNGRDVKKMPVRVRQVWSSVQNREKVEATYAKIQSDRKTRNISTSCNALPRSWSGDLNPPRTRNN